MVVRRGTDLVEARPVLLLADEAGEHTSLYHQHPRIFERNRSRGTDVEVWIENLTRIAAVLSSAQAGEHLRANQSRRARFADALLGVFGGLNHRSAKRRSARLYPDDQRLRTIPPN